MKTVGLLLLLAVAVSAGFYGASMAERELAQTAALLDLLRYLRAGVEKDLPSRRCFCSTETRAAGAFPGHIPYSAAAFSQDCGRARAFATRSAAATPSGGGRRHCFRSWNAP